MKILEKRITVRELQGIAEGRFGDLVKAVVDVEQRIIAIDAELHSDLEALLIDEGSTQNDLWGVNFYPGLSGDDFLEFDSMINLRPSQGNMSRGVDDESLRKEIAGIIDEWIER